MFISFLQHRTQSAFCIVRITSAEGDVKPSIDDFYTVGRVVSQHFLNRYLPWLNSCVRIQFSQSPGDPGNGIVRRDRQSPIECSPRDSL